MHYENNTIIIIIIIEYNWSHHCKMYESLEIGTLREQFCLTFI